MRFGLKSISDELVLSLPPNPNIFEINLMIYLTKNLFFFFFLGNCRKKMVEA